MISENKMNIQEKQIKEIEELCKSCHRCQLSKTRNNVVFSDGKVSAPIMLIGEAPGAEEDLTGKPFVGRAGKLLNKFLEEAGISRENDLYICNTVKCRPPENRTPSNEEKSLCREYLLKQIEIVNPKVIILCGATAATSFIEKKFQITKIRGQWFKIEDKYNAMVIFHPSYLLRNHSEAENSPRFLTKNDLLKIKSTIK